MLVGVAVTAAVAAVLLRSTQPAYALVLTVSAGVLILGAVLVEAIPIVEHITALLSRAVPDGVYTETLIKALGIAVLTQSTADVCRDAGETALAGKTELAGNVLLLLCGLPLYEKALAMLEGIIVGQAVIG